MRILLFTPAPLGSTKGNRITAERWAGQLTELGHDVCVCDPLSAAMDNAAFDCLICIHATRSANTIIDFQANAADRPVVLCLSGTDLHLDAPGSRGTKAQHEALESIRRSSRLILLEPQAANQLPPQARSKVVVILQSAVPVSSASKRTDDEFRVCVLGHLRAEKDPLLTATAARTLPAASRVKVIHIGEALNAQIDRSVQNEMKTNHRYRWLGACPHAEAQRRLAESDLMVLSSKVEGAPSVISEAIVNGVPILATRIPATIGLLGDDYPGLFPVGDSDTLATLMDRAEQDDSFLGQLKDAIDKLAAKFTPQAERDALQRLLKSLG